MTSVGQIEKRTQARVVALFRERLGYDYIGNLIVQDNRNKAVYELLRYGVGRRQLPWPPRVASRRNVTRWVTTQPNFRQTYWIQPKLG